MGTRKIKKQVLNLLSSNDLASIEEQLAQLDAKEVVNALFSAISRSEELLRWQAVSCMGTAVNRLAGEDMEEARIIMRRMLWSLNDESGGIGWGAPESMAEIMVLNETLAREYVHMLLSYMREDGDEAFQDGNYLEYATLQQGLLWGAARLAARRRQLVVEKGMAADLPPYLSSSDPTVRGLAAYTIGILGEPGEAVEQIHELAADTTKVRLYADGIIGVVSVASLAEDAIGRLTP